MRTRREQVQAYRFVTRRISSALLSGEPETTELPMRRLGLAVFGSTMLAAIVLAGVGVYAILRPGGGQPDDNAVVIERDTGARYVFVKERLHPVLNYSSALLVIGETKPKIQRLSRRSLQGVPRGAPVGIPNAPDALPDPKALLGPPWTTCTMRRTPGSTALATHLLVGGVPAGGADLGRDALLVSAGTSADALMYLLWNNRRHKIVEREVLAALEIASARPVPVGQALLNSVTAGPDLKAGFVNNAGQPGPVIGGVPGTLGQVYRTGNQFYVLLEQGLVPIGEVMARLLMADGGQPTEISASEAGSLQASVRFEPDGFPYDMPLLRNTGTELPMVCSTYRGTGSAADGLTTVQLFQRPDPELAEASAGELPPADTGPDGVRLADRVVVPGGRGALVRVLPAPDTPAPNTTTYLVTDQGIKYALPRPEEQEQGGPVVQDILGYAGVDPTPVPSFLLALVRTGPALDPRDAQQFRADAEDGSERNP